jgi:DNA helicase-4
MDLQRTTLARLFRLFMRDGLRGVTMTPDGLVLRRRDGDQRVSRADVSSLRATRGKLWSKLDITSATERVSFWGVSRRDADDFAVRWHRTEISDLASWVRAQQSPLRYLSQARYAAISGRVQAVLAQLRDPVSADPEAASDIAALRQMARDEELFRNTVNTRYLALEESRSKTFFDTVENKPLTTEQRQAVLVDEDRNLVVAAAGSGKTSVIVAKVAHLMRQGFIRPSEIVVVAFNRNAAEELAQRLSSRLGPDADQLTVSTFHKLGKNIIAETDGQEPRLREGEGDQLALTVSLKAIVDELVEADAIFANAVRSWFTSYAAPYRSAFEFEDLGEYYAYIRNYEIRSLNGELLKSLEECEIANWLFVNGVAYVYEKEYAIPATTPSRGRYKPDFYLPEYDIWIEHFALNKEARTPPFIDNEKYLQDRKWKLEVHRQSGTTLVQSFSHQKASDTLLFVLERHLTARGVKLAPLDAKDILAKLNELGRLDPFFRLLTTFLNLCKGSASSLPLLQLRAAMSKSRQRNAAFVSLFGPVWLQYEDRLQSREEIDFHDMILKATEYIASGRWRSPYAYICVDEFQDLSPSRGKLLQALLSQNPMHQLFAVGDDWQSIYRFAGSDSAVMRNFERNFAPAQRRDLTTTFRCSESIAAASSRFITANPLQLQKVVRAVRGSGGPDVHILQHPAVVNRDRGQPAQPDDPRIALIVDATRNWLSSSIDHRASVLLLGRYRHSKPHFLSRLRRKVPEATFDYLTVHKSKGMEADLVFIVDVNEGHSGFPSRTEDDPVLEIVLTSPDPFPDAEERRLFYVALTRARHAVFVMADAGRPSPFVKELATYLGICSSGDMADAQKRPCPTCKRGQLVLRRGRDRVFFGCSYYPPCDHTQPACPLCGTGFMDLQNGRYVCSQCNWSTEICPKCQLGWRVRRRGPTSEFWGCSRFPACKYTGRIDAS